MTTIKKYTLIKKAPYGALLLPCVPLEDSEEQAVFPEHQREVIVRMAQILMKRGLQGISSNQVGSNLRVFITNVPGDIIRVFANPEMEITDYDEEEVRESCGSYARYPAPRYRHRHVSIWYKNLGGFPHELHTTDYKFKEHVSKALSYRIQHEMEHLNGVNVRLEQTVVDDLGLDLEEMAPLESY